ncbi:acetyl-CoA carboxylase carboxyltransferase subunit alpha [Carboxydocella sporoproducens DSM 16521]|uniref:Acetyl-coenzyme A carboxylase carboxyl transferase subunit alpha n=2 Tax=Carboxydocella TaxID=178898 RepID=A0A1T4LB28_9FIRM|nr:MULTISPECIES: acetyl-CoA carboxylase carboxyltransferase subunit alpha [Carboxydocella]AVX19877.1 acetyl-CoA carboxylase carboxyl transferase subunit alpha [Carboxydocella thermautotrophica]SJZ51801.1 acetyl-CoA carboxylase carboxyltransferase subunit alpha [Carboxydocella sporoproducens DSM 16521]
MAVTLLEFEKPLLELENKIAELRKFSQEKGIDLSREIATMEEKARQLSQEIYTNLTPWQKVQIARHPQRPTTLDYINLIFDDFIELHGDRNFADDAALVGGIALLEGRPVTVLGHQKGRDTRENIARNFGMPHPEGYRKAIRLMEQAQRFKRPIITFIDTPGAFCGIGAEERGQGEAIARALYAMAGLSVPLLAVVIGEGGSGGALALGLGNKVYMLEYSVYSVISPEGFAAILWKDGSQAPRAAETMKLTAQDLLQLGVIDGIIPEPLAGAHRDHEFTASKVKEQLLQGLQELAGQTGEQLMEQRYQRFRRIGSFQEG